MRLLKLLILSAFIILSFQTVHAQKSKQSKKMDKATKKQLKSFMKNPASYRRKERAVQETLDSAAFQIAVLEERYDEIKVLNRIYYDSITELNAHIRDLEAMENAIRTTIESSLELEYRVQIGAYAVNDFDGKAGLGNAIKTEIVDGVTKYYVGSFENPFDAEDFASAIRTMGIDGAFVTKFIDGERVPFSMNDLIGK